jgi:hypothetical protein
MQTGGFTETIWHFAGYLHIADALARAQVLFDGDPQKPLPVENPALFRAPEKGLAFDELVSLPTLFWDSPVVEPDGEAQTAEIPPYRAPPLKPPLLPPLPQKRFEPPEEIADQARYGARSIERLITVEYQDGGMENLLAIRQINLQSDQDLVTSDAIAWPDGSPVIPDVLNLDAQLAGMIAQAEAAAPEGLPDLVAASKTGTEEVIAAFDARTARWTETGSPNRDGSPAETAPEGRIVDGVAAGSEPPAPSLIQIAPWRPEEDEPSSEAEASLTTLGPTGGMAALAETGLNLQANAAAIIDTGEAVGSMVVGGDYFYSRGIVQVNVLVDNDHVDLALSDAMAPVVRTDGNEVHNIAEFVTHLSTASVRGASGTPLWSVDVIAGDFYDVKSVVQFNGLDDSDRVAQASSGTYFDLRAGANQQVNLTEIYGADSYDIIIIGGDYHRADWIYQYNIMLDPDMAKIFARGDTGDSATVTAGFNQLTNTASIETYDAEGFKPMLDAHHELMGLLQGRATVLTPNPEWNLYGNASGTLKILYVPGDYYDLNVITQVNFLTDADQLIQGSAQAGTTLGVAAGGNIALNEAYIIDPGLLSTSNYLGGETYEESVLIQVNMITDSDTVEIHDTNTLVAELVAFAEQAEAEPDCPPPQVVDPAHHDHLMSNMLA